MTVVLKIEEDMDAMAMAGLRDIFDDLANTVDNVTLDLSRVSFIDSSGIGGLVFLYKRLVARGHRLQLAAVSGQPLRLLSHLRMDELILKGRENAA